MALAAQKYDRNTRTKTGKMKTGAKVLVGVIVFSLLIILGFVGYMVYQGMKPTTIVIEQDELKISGPYGQLVSLADIIEIQLIDTLPDIQLRTNGSAIGSVLQGHFKLAEVGQAMLYLDRNLPPFIYLETSSQKIYFNLATAEQTRQLFGELQALVTK